MAVARARPNPRSRSRRKPNKGSGGGIILLVIMLVVPATIFMLPMTVIACLGMIPTVVAFVADRDPEKMAPITVGAMNLCGVLPFAIEFLEQRDDLERLAEMIANPATWLVMYGAAAVGWALYFAIPTLVSNFEIMRGQGRIDHLERKKKRLEDEWGSAVRSDDDPDGLPAPGEPPAPASAPASAAPARPAPPMRPAGRQGPLPRRR